MRVSFDGGATGNRTRDTRIFSPLLYRLSYGTIGLFLTGTKVQRVFQLRNRGVEFFII